MPLGLFLLFLCENTAKSEAMEASTITTTPTTTMRETLSPLQLVATPDYPVAAGQKVNLHCSAVTIPASASWSWERLTNQTWNTMNISGDLSLTEPEESGVYRCTAMYQSSHTVSPNHTVYIVSTLPTVGENLGIIAFVLSLLSLIINLAILSWLGRRTLDVTFTTSTTAAKDFPGPEKTPKGGFPQTEDDGDVYMNYSRTNQAYSDLDPTSMNNMYATLS